MQFQYPIAYKNSAVGLAWLPSFAYYPGKTMINTKRLS